MRTNMTPDEAIATCATAGHYLPREAMQWALDHRHEAVPPFLDLLEAYVSGVDRSEATRDALFCIIHLLAEMRETRAFQPLCRLMHQAQPLDDALGDATTATLAQILIALFDGDVDPLKSVIEDCGADQWVRAQALGALAYLTREGRQSDDAMRAYLSTLHETLKPEPECYVWADWILAVANLGYEDLAPQAEALIAADIPPRFTDVELFRKDLRRALDDPERLAGFRHDNVQPFADAIGTLATWDHFSPEAQRRAERAATSAAHDDDASGHVWAEPRVNPLRHVGRNDPCPCGSGKKYKKCCLDKAA
ncbi:MAG: DUF1186 domain-containing protein [Stellaceae bacterium]